MHSHISNACTDQIISTVSNSNSIKNMFRKFNYKLCCYNEHNKKIQLLIKTHRWEILPRTPDCWDTAHVPSAKPQPQTHHERTDTLPGLQRTTQNKSSRWSVWLRVRRHTPNRPNDWLIEAQKDHRLVTQTDNSTTSTLLLVHSKLFVYCRWLPGDWFTLRTAFSSLYF